MASSRSRLSLLQSEFLHGFADASPSFFLTGGAVLAGLSFGHRTTDDLDFFTVDAAAMGEAATTARFVAEKVGATLESLATSPDHRRYLATRGDEAVRVDIVFDRAPQLRPKIKLDGVLCDSLEEILVNKLCTLVERSEVRDLVDILWLERSGLRVEDFLTDASRKDSGFSPSTAAWLLRSFRVAADRVPDGTDPVELEAFRQNLESRLRAASFPG